VLARDHVRPVPDPQGKVGRTGARINNLVKRHFVELIKAYQALWPAERFGGSRGADELDCRCHDLRFGHFVSRSGGSVVDLRRTDGSHIQFILAGLITRRPKRRIGVGSKYLIAVHGTQS
jgi:hypothetical protein